jgi:hypothetical protein
VGDFAVVDDSYVAARGQELHHFRSLVRQLRPGGFSLRVLFQAAYERAFPFKIDLSELVLRGAPNGKRVVAQLDSFRGLDAWLGRTPMIGNPRSSHDLNVKFGGCEFGDRWQGKHLAELGRSSAAPQQRMSEDVAKLE